MPPTSSSNPNARTTPRVGLNPPEMSSSTAPLYHFQKCGFSGGVEPTVIRLARSCRHCCHAPRSSLLRSDCQHHIATVERRRAIVIARVRRIFPFTDRFGIHRHDIYGDQFAQVPRSDSQPIP